MVTCVHKSSEAYVQNNVPVEKDKGQAIVSMYRSEHASNHGDLVRVLGSGYEWQTKSMVIASLPGLVLSRNLRLELF
jgi:hypothetical protein